MYCDWMNEWMNGRGSEQAGRQAVSGWFVLLWWGQHYSLVDGQLRHYFKDIWSLLIGSMLLSESHNYLIAYLLHGLVIYCVHVLKWRKFNYVKDVRSNLSLRRSFRFPGVFMLLRFNSLCYTLRRNPRNIAVLCVE